MFPFRKSVISNEEDFLINEGQENLLLILSENDSYGQYMVNVISFSSDYKINLLSGSVYRTLKMLCDKGMIKRVYSTQVQDKRNSDKHRYYKITDKGVKALEYKKEFRKKLVENSKRNGKEMTIDLSTL